MPDPDQLPYDSDRVIRSLAERNAVLAVENAKLEAALTQLVQQQIEANRAADEAKTAKP